MDKELASKLIAEHLAIARAALDAAVEVSEKTGVAFELPWGGEGTYEAGIGATYVPTSYDSSDRWYNHCNVGWNPSAGSC